MTHRAEIRSGGRHRQERVRRHRAPRTVVLPVAGERGRTALLTATLGAALATGVAGGGAAAAAERHAQADATGSIPANTPATADLTAATPGLPATDHELLAAQAADRNLLAAQAADRNLLAAQAAGRNLLAAQAAGRDALAAQATGRDPLAAQADRDPLAARAGGSVLAARVGDRDPLSAGIVEPDFSPELSVERVKRKQRPAPVIEAAARTEASAAWVNPNPAGVVTSCFGERWGRQHQGVDIASPHGSPIVAAGAGVVVRAGVAGGYGNAVLIDHGNGYLTHYGHLATIGVREGQRVAAGQQIGAEGSTGHSTGPHLHFEVHQGSYKNPIEPTRWLHDRGVHLRGC